jgi:preprotein translocase subunit SecG
MLLAQIPVWAVGLLVALFLLVSVGLILTVLIQRPMGGGLSGAFGSGAGSGQTAFGAKTGDVLTMFTIIVFAVWLLGAKTLNFATRPPSAGGGAQVAPAGAPTTDQSAAEQAAGEQAQPTGDQTPPEAPGEQQAPPGGEGAGADDQSPGGEWAPGGGEPDGGDPPGAG